MKKILIALFIGLSAVNGQCSQLSELRTEVRYLINDNGTSDTYAFTDSILNYWINEAHRQVLKDSLATRHRANITTVLGQREYTLATDLMEMVAVYIVNSDSTSTYKRIAQAEIDTLDEEKPFWEDADNAEPVQYYIRPTTYSVVIGLYPEPDSDHAGTNYLRYDYIPTPPTLSSDTDEPFYGLDYLEPYEDAIVYYAVHRALRSADWLTVYKTRIAEMKKDINMVYDKITQIKYRGR